MTPPPVEHHMLAPNLSAPLVCLIAAGLVAAWVGAHFLKRRVALRWLKAFLYAVRIAVGFIAILAVMEAAQRVVLFATNWPVWPIALGGAVAVESLLSLYELERRVVPRRTGLALGALRLALALLVVAMLVQPVRSLSWTRRVERSVVVLVDNSASMHVPDKQMTPAERIRLAETFSVEGARRPFRFEGVAKGLRKIREELSPHVDWLASLSEAKPTMRQKQLESRRASMHESLEALAEAVAEQADAAVEPLEGELELDNRTRLVLTHLKETLTSEVRDRLAEAVKMTDEENLPKVARELDTLFESLRRASTVLVDVQPKLRALGETLDEAVYKSLPAEKRVKVDAVARMNRFELARDLLVYGTLANPGRRRAGAGLIARLQDEYDVKLYTFAANPAEAKIEQWMDDQSAPAGEEAAAGLPPEQQQTNLAAALQKVMMEVPVEKLAGILLLSDGRHNAPARVEPLARRLGIQQVPLCSVVFGAGDKPTVDAAIVSLEAPETVYSKDQMYITAELRLDGLKGKTVKVTLYDGEEAVDSEEIEVEADSFRTRVQLADEPEDTGMHAYRVRIEDLEDEVLATNNERPLSVSVTDDQTRLLVIEGRPRWEFRYLKNLFASRDRTVRLQYVLLQPDLIPGQPPRPKVPASATRPQDEPEATTVPEDESEWMKFDVIVLGDVEPSALREEDLKALKKFVEDRAGTLIVIAGPRHMPHAYAETPLAEVLPVSFTAVEEDYLEAAEESFRVCLTAEGRESVVTRLRVDSEENLATWDSVPDIHWRHPTVAATEAGTVLAYASPPTPPDFMTPKGPHEVPDEETLGLRHEFEREHALITVHHVALGRVMFLSFDHTWRLRYRVGDTYHHRLWGQVLRWATADKLPAGTNLVKVGTDRPRYPPHSKIRVRARIMRPDYSPLVSNDVIAKIYDGDQLVRRMKLDYVEGSLGMYEGELGELPGGNYRLELDSPAIEALLAAENAEKVSTEFSVETAAVAEQIELSADRGLLEQLASLTNGMVVDPARASEALDALGPGVLTHHERRQYSLWDSWPLLSIIVVVAAAEWLLRKRARLP